MNEWEIKNINDFQDVTNTILDKATEILESKNNATVVALHGDLGSGKTTFTKQLAKELGIKETITSPTFVIQKRFDIPKENNIYKFDKLIHIDTYRIDLQDELIKLGWNEDVAQSQNIISIEWPENVIDILPENTIHLYFEFIDETTRVVRLK